MPRLTLPNPKPRARPALAVAATPHTAHHPPMLRCVTVLVLLASAVAAMPAAAAPTGTLSATYDGYAHGVLSLRLTASFTLTPNGYAGRLEFHTAGMLGWMVHTESDSQVQGRFLPGAAGGSAVPIRFDSTGFAHGRDRLTHIRFENGNPHVETLQPPTDGERAPVPVAETAHTIDTLSAIAMLMRQVGEVRRCDGSARTFDGRRLTALTASTAGPATLPPQRKLNFDGETLRCDFVGVQLAGFVANQDEAISRRPRHGSAWLANLVPGAPPVPVKVVFEHQQLGTVTLTLTSVSGSPGQIAQNR